MTMQPVSLPRPSDKWIPWYFVLFFGVIAAVLGVMVFLAVHTYSGVVTSDAYEKGLAYNKTLAAAHTQMQQGWTGDVTLVGGAEAVAATFVLREKSGAPVDDAQVKLWLKRPTRDGLDQVVVMEPAGEGRYRATLNLPARGAWIAHVAAAARATDFQIERRVVVP